MQENSKENSPIKERILHYLENKGVTPYKFYKDSGITKGILGQKNGISEDNLLMFLEYAKDISHVWLLTGSGEMLKDVCKSAVPKAYQAEHGDTPARACDDPVSYNVPAEADVIKDLRERLAIAEERARLYKEQVDMLRDHIETLKGSAGERANH